jgi:iron complex transport system substrate-binding protein
MPLITRALAALTLLAVLTACGGPAAAPAAEATIAPTTAPSLAPTAVAPTAAPTAAATTEPAPPQATTAAAPSTDAAFPLTVKHKYGSTTIEKVPERIVTVGLTDHDALLALGIVPVGTTEWFGEYPSSIWPWAQDRLSDAKPENVGDGDTIKFETITALRPDLILALYGGLTQEQYNLLTKIAPTVAQPEGYVDYGIPWQELTRTVGQIVGQAQQADMLVTNVEKRFEEARAAHPEFAGATALVATPYEGIWVYGPEDVRGRFLTSLGFKLPTDLVEVTGAEFGGNLSLERADMLNVDAIIWLDAAEAKGPLGGPIYASLPVHTEGREVFLDSYKSPLGGATSFVSVLSLPFLLDGLVPLLAAAVDGDTSTKVELPAQP